ncbi:MAG: hypothetical protein MZV70_44850 [Desulfobacterales bacterium]|nr:hypothetical protein [Desulfobacterales bacterium]
MLSPLGGVIVEVNPKVREAPAAANREPYGEGWLFLVRTPDVKDAAEAPDDRSANHGLDEDRGGPARAHDRGGRRSAGGRRRDISRTTYTATCPDWGGIG